MSVSNALAGVAVNNIESASEWYQRLIGIAAEQPMAGVVEFSLPSGGALQLFEDSKRAGSASVTLSVTELDSFVERLSGFGIEASERSQSDIVSTATVQDPDGNQIVLAQQHSDKVAS